MACEQPPKRRPVPTSSVAIFDLCTNKTFIAVTAGNAYDRHVISGSDIEGLGPAIQDLVVHAEASNLNNFAYKVVLERRMVSGPWEEVAELLPEQGAAGYVVSTPFTDREKFGIRTRIVLAIRIARGEAPQSADISIRIALRFFCT